MADELDVTCTALDELLEEFLVEWATYRTLMTSFSNCMKNGFLCVSKARYSMGVASVSELQVPDDEFKALIEARPFEGEEQTEKDHGSLYFEMKRLYPRNKLSTGDLKGDESGADDSSTRHAESSGVRKRFVSGKQPPQEDASAVASINGGEKVREINTVSSSDFRPDPLNWFGLLVPNALRQGQNYFQTAASTSIELVNLKMKLHYIIDEYKELKEKKHSLLTHVDTISSSNETLP